jgi:sulfatase-modifying factor enzyme 1
MARYPVTNAQYQAFLDEGGYETDAWWEGLAARRGPARGTWTDPNAPRDTVSWYEAMAYARWLGRPVPGSGALAGRPGRAAAHRGRVGESGPRPRWPGIPLGRIRLGARQYQRNLGQDRTPLSRADLRRRPLPGRRFPLRRARYGRECLGMVPQRIPASRAPRAGRGMLGGWCAAAPGPTTQATRAVPIATAARSATASPIWVCGWCVWLPSPEPLGAGALAKDL